MPIEHQNLTSVHRVGHVANSDPGAVGAYKAWIDTNSTPWILKVRNVTNTAWVVVGEINTASNIGTGSNVFKQKTGQDLEFRTIIGTGGITITQNPNDLTIGINHAAVSPEEVNDYYAVHFVLTQSGTGNPSVYEVVNHTTAVPSWSRASTGIYECTFDASILPLGGTVVQVTYGQNTNDPTADGIIVTGYRKTDTVVAIRCYNAAGALADINAANWSVSIYIQNI